jgi:hypothetical protein
MAPIAQRALPAEQIPLAALGFANRRIDEWLGDDNASSLACRNTGRSAEIRDGVLRQVDCVLRQSDPIRANRRWLCGTVRAWATLRVLFPRQSELDVRGVSGELTRYFPLVVEREYAHVLAGVRSTDKVQEILLGDAQCLELQMVIGDALRELLQDEGQDWIGEFRELSLAMAEYLHRHAIGLNQLLGDTDVMTYTSRLARMQRECRTAPKTQTALAASGA